ncbi:MAG: Xaa-Pro peptidase family protein [Candidatus Verstraetearchaeota archaeon]|nr:Xaa-Pro peptidase family protein [Candidatus Verstraetearchaeota archaeon]
MDYAGRISKLASKLDDEGILAALITAPENIHYLTGAPFVRGSAGKLLLVWKEGHATLILTELDYEEAKDSVAGGLELIKTNLFERPLERLRSILPSSSKVGYEEGAMSAAMNDRIGANYVLVPLGGAIEKMREIKDKEEISMIEKAQSINDQAFEKALANFREGMTELEIAAELEYMIRRYGGEAYAFETIVASGPRGVYPHGMPSNRRPSGGESVVIDFGAKYGGYCSDMTRTVFFGEPKPELRKMYEAVRDAQEAAIEEVSIGVTGKELDDVARRVIGDHGYGKYFVHGLGHGVGIDIHEAPTVSASNPNPLSPGNVITIEPGVYVPGVGGVRIEDLLVVTEGGRRNLTKFSREIVVV